MKSKPPIHIVFPGWDVTFKNKSTDPTRVVTVGVFIDLEALAELAIQASQNKSRKAKDGALHVEVHTIREVEG